MRHLASLKATIMQATITTVSSYNCFGYLGNFEILEKLGASLGRVFSANWGEWVSGLCHSDQSPMGIHLRVKTQPIRVTFGPKIDSPNAMINIR